MRIDPWRAVLPVLAANVLFGAGLFAHAFLYNFYLEAAGHGAVVWGNAAAALTAGGLAALLPAGALVDRRGPVSGYAVASLLGAVGLGIGAIVTAPWAVYAAAFLAGGGTATWRVSMAPLLLQRTRGAVRARALSWNVALLVGTGAAWTVLSGNIPAWLQGAGWAEAPAIRAVLFAGAVATGVAVTPLLAGRSAAPPMPPPDALPAGRGLPAGLLVAVVLVGVWMAGSGLVIPFFNVYFANEHGLPVDRVALILALSQGLTAVALAGSAEVAARLGARRALLVWMVLFPPVLLMLAITDALALAIGLFLVQGIVPAATNPLIDQVLLERTAPERHGVVSSARNAATELSGLAGASIGGRLLAALSFGGLFVCAALIAAAGGTGLAAWLSKTQREPIETRPRSTRQSRSA